MNIVQSLLFHGLFSFSAAHKTDGVVDRMTIHLAAKELGGQTPSFVTFVFGVGFDLYLADTG